MKPTVRILLAFILVLGALPAAAGPRPHPARKTRAASAAARKGRPPLVPIDATTVNDPDLAAPVAPGRSGGAVLRSQVLLARAHFSPGEIDAKYGTGLQKAIAAFQRSKSLPETGRVDAATWGTLNAGADAGPALSQAPIAPEDVAGPFLPIPEDMAEKAKLPAMNYSSPLEGLAEKYHVSPDLLKRLNPAATFDQAGQMLTVPNVLTPAPGKAARVRVSKSERSVTAYDEQGQALSWYPATIGSEHDPLPLGQWKIRGVSRNPRFRYNPALFWDARPGEGPEWIPAGPNNPVGVAWVDLSKPHYGIHGTPEPSRVGKSESHGCIRLTNWDVWELQQMVSPGTPVILEE